MSERVYTSETALACPAKVCDGCCVPGDYCECHDCYICGEVDCAHDHDVKAVRS